MKIDLKGPEQARDAAVTSASELLKEADGKFCSGPEWWMQVTDEEEATVCILN